MIYPDKIWIKQIDIGTAVRLQRVISKAIWRPAPGRKLSFLVRHENTTIGLITLVSPVINLEARDRYLKLSKNSSEKGGQLRSYMDMSGCVGIQPLAWHWNVGKLLALLATTLGDFVYRRYPDDEFKGIITTSIYGRSSQYNRVYKFLGYTKGYGHEHVSDKQYLEMIEWMKKNNVEVPSCRFGAGSNARMRRICAYSKASGDRIPLKHGKIRGIYYHESTVPDGRAGIIQGWYSRWGLPRYERTKNADPPYTDGLS
jgi:hypothetical protein